MTRLLYGRLTAILTLFLLGGAGYVLIEMAWRGRSHVSMFVVGGLCCCLLMGLARMARIPFAVKCVLAGVLISAVEFAAGCVLNLWLDLGVWDYSSLPFQLLGQISLPYSMLWCVLSACVLPLMSAAERKFRRTAEKT